ncbi:hypothetical protein [Methanospirillum hungatei]|uniref:hypothetical protein n=1 Tax=Methanospirillum hungatei TaxID=2203 RepID=UPI0026EFDB8C|nr:hypothetical protein [Methanospirillum hungatei]MCA1916654.1 hypothetical protein [Methanospirillum hungatei]
MSYILAATLKTDEHLPLRSGGINGRFPKSLTCPCAPIVIAVGDISQAMENT